MPIPSEEKFQAIAQKLMAIAEHLDLHNPDDLSLAKTLELAGVIWGMGGAQQLYDNHFRDLDIRLGQEVMNVQLIGAEHPEREPA